MNTPTIDAIRKDPELLQALHAAARRERAAHFHCLLQRLFAGWRKRPYRTHRQRPVAALRTAPCG